MDTKSAIIFAAQRHFASLDLYPFNAIDGVDGPLTQLAARKFAAKQTPNDTPYQWLSAHIGEREIAGDRHNPIIVDMFDVVGADWYKDDETYWCGAAVGAAAVHTGYQTPSPTWKSVTAKEWANVGDHVDLENAKKGDVAVVHRRGGYHVAFVHSYSNDSPTFQILGGNQSDSVCIQNRSKRDIVAIRRLRKI